MDQTRPATDAPDDGSRWAQAVGALGERVSEQVEALTDRDAAAADPELAALEAAVVAVPGVAALDPGALGELTTRLPGRRGTGISLTDDEAVVRVVLDDDAPVRATAAVVRDLVAPHTSGSVRVLVVDVRAHR